MMRFAVILLATVFPGLAASETWICTPKSGALFRYDRINKTWRTEEIATSSGLVDRPIVITKNSGVWRSKYQEFDGTGDCTALAPLGSTERIVCADLQYTVVFHPYSLTYTYESREGFSLGGLNSVGVGGIAGVAAIGLCKEFTEGK